MSEPLFELLSHFLKLSPHNPVWQSTLNSQAGGSSLHV